MKDGRDGAPHEFGERNVAVDGRAGGEFFGAKGCEGGRCDDAAGNSQARDQQTPIVVM